VPEPAPKATTAFVQRIEELVAEAVAAGVPARALATRLRKIAGRLDPGEQV
jgi:hypothetical protein